MLRQLDRSRKLDAAFVVLGSEYDGANLAVENDIFFHFFYRIHFSPNLIASSYIFANHPAARSRSNFP